MTKKTRYTCINIKRGQLGHNYAKTSTHFMHTELDVTILKSSRSVWNDRGVMK